MSPPSKWKVALVGLFLAFQAAVPARALFAERPARFGWQMYANFPSLPDVFLVAEGGRETPVDLQHVLAVPRAEIDYAVAATRSLCGDGIAAIRISDRDGSEDVVQCR
jgi:hypothetical protein